MKRILVVADEVSIVELLANRLRQEGYEVSSESDGVSGLASVKRSTPDLLILDIVLAKLSGLDVCTEIRRDPGMRAIRILMLSGRGSETDRVVGLEVGADDYMVKPFSLPELVARVRALLRRWDRNGDDSRNGAAVQTISLHRGELLIDPALKTVTLAGTDVPLTGLEFRLLHLLAAEPNKVFSREELMSAVWGNERHVTMRSVDTYFWRLREKLESDPQKPLYLKTVRGSGYTFALNKESAINILPIRAKTKAV